MEGVKSRLARGYSRTAPLYDEVAGQMYLAGLRRLLPLLRLPSHPAILDVGCGTALNLIEAARQFGPARLLAGIDISPGMVALARAKTAALGIPAQIIHGDAERLPFPDDCFDLVICNSVLHWFRDRAGAMREMVRTLRPGGQVALITAVQPGFGEWFALVDTIMRSAFADCAPSAAPGLPTGQEVAAIMQGAGLNTLYFQNLLSRSLIHTPAPFVHLMSVVAPHWAADLSDLDVARLQQMAIHFMQAGWPGGFPFTWSTVEAVGRKEYSALIRKAS